jgi:hypothetical protein
MIPLLLSTCSWRRIPSLRRKAATILTALKPESVNSKPGCVLPGWWLTKFGPQMTAYKAVRSGQMLELAN